MQLEVALSIAKGILGTRKGQQVDYELLSLVANLDCANLSAAELGTHVGLCVESYHFFLGYE